MNKIIVFIMISLLSVISFAEKVTVLQELVKPQNLLMDQNQMYIAEGTTVYIYNASNFKLIKKFGKPGEGPKEFNIAGGQVPLGLYVESKELLINSFGKISYFTKSGEFIKEIKNHSGINLYFWPVKDRFVGLGITGIGGERFRVVNIFDQKLNKIKEIFRARDDFQTSGPIRVLRTQLQYYAYKDNIFITGMKGFVVKILDIEGNQISSIERKYKPVKFTDKDKEDLIKTITANPQQRQFYEANKQRFEYPKVWPNIATMIISDDHIYLVTFKRDGNKFEYFIYSTKGKFVRTGVVPFYLSSPLGAYPTAIKNQKVYQVIENDDEEWELHVNPIK